MAKASDGDDILTLPEAQELLRERLPGRLRTVDADGLCLFHCLTSVSPEADVARMQEAAGCPAGVWGSEEHLDLLAGALDLRVVVWPIELLAFDQSLQTNFKREHGPDSEKVLHLVHWCRDSIG